MINFLFGLFQSLNGLRYTLWVLWRLKVNIWFCLPSLQFTDKYQVSCRLPEIKVSFLEKKKGGETDWAQQAAFTQSILRYPVAEMNSNFSVKKGKGACRTPCGPQMFQLLPLSAETIFFKHCPNTQSKRVFLQRHLAKAKNTVDKVRKRPQERSLYIEFVRIRRNKEWGALSPGCLL